MNSNNLFTILAVVLLGYMLYPKIMIKFNKNVKNVSGDEATSLIKATKDLVIIDVRSKGEYQLGHINGSKLMPAGEMPSRINELEKFRGRPILVHCASGGRSPKAVNVLLKNKFGPIYHMNHGLSGFNGNLKK
ncbi:MAG: rhodanese-like domain-containing protein [Clostridium sp.]|uniref:rhodanese-like domain-containing protein n=1 Tax=Clostridium sp. TaxID=1506 RepID=UPI003D6C76D5